MTQSHTERAPGAYGFSSGTQRAQGGHPPSQHCGSPPGRPIWVSPHGDHKEAAGLDTGDHIKAGDRAYSNQHLDLGRVSSSSRWRRRSQPVALPIVRAKPMWPEYLMHNSAWFDPQTTSNAGLRACSAAPPGQGSRLLPPPTVEDSPQSCLIRKHNESTWEAKWPTL